jgi:cell wall-associated NlpC family hydrolase
MKGLVWLIWLLQEMLGWGAAVLLLLALPWFHYRQVLEPQLGLVHQLQEVFEQEMQTLQSGDWEKWAREAMARIQQIGKKKGTEGGDKMGRAPSGRGMIAEKGIAETRTAVAAESGRSQRGNILLRVPGVGPEDVMWTAVDEFYAAPYLYGGEDRFGVDCSALVQEVFARLGVGLPRTAQEQFDSPLGVYVGWGDLRPGDLVFFHTRTHPFISHVGIYLGKDEFLHAPRSGRRVEKAPLSGFYRKRFVAGKRILSDPFADLDSIGINQTELLFPLRKE